MNELEIRKYIRNAIKTGAKEIEKRGSITLCFSNLKSSSLFFGKYIEDEQGLFDAVKHFKEVFGEKYIIDLKHDSIPLSDTLLEVYHVIIKNNMAKVDSLSNTKEGLSMENLNKLKDALLIIKNYCKGKDCKRCGLSSDEACILTLNTPQDWTILDEPTIKIMVDE